MDGTSSDKMRPSVVEAVKATATMGKPGKFELQKTNLAILSENELRV
jgi:hypothetical protein